MGTIADKLNYTKTNIDELKELTNESVLANVVERIKEDYKKDWKPNQNWWDIDKILEEDTEEYQAKIIALFADCNDISTINKLNADKIKTSDGAIYTDSVTHEWDKSRDKECAVGYKTRYVIWYYTNNNININSTFGDNNCLYFIIKNANFNFSNENNQIYKDCNLLECIKMINSNYLGTKLTFGNVGLYKLQKIDGLVAENVTTVTNLFMGCNSLSSKEIEENIQKLDWSKITYAANAFYNNARLERFLNVDTSKIESFASMFFGASSLTTIENLDFDSATNLSMTLSGTTNNLISINNIANIKTNGFSLNLCTRLNYETLIRVINALYDYSDDSETHTITFGATNLAKLTEEELAVAQNKNWTIS